MKDPQKVSRILLEFESVSICSCVSHALFCEKVVNFDKRITLVPSISNDFMVCKVYHESVGINFIQMLATSVILLSKLATFS